MKQVNRSRLSRFLGVSLTTLDNWVRNGLPHVKAGRSLLFNISEVQEWLEKRKGSNGIQAQILAEKLRFQKARCRREELQVSELEGKLISLDKLKTDLTSIFLAMKSALLLWEKRLPGLLEGKDQKKMYLVIHKETRDILTDFSKGTKALCKKR